MHRSGTASPTLRRRLFLLAAGLCVVPVGLAARFLVAGGVGDATGGFLYAVMIYLLVALVVPAWRPAVVAVAALGICWAVEFLQLTAFPREVAAVFPPARLVLGSTFVAGDLVAYAAGAGAAWVADQGLSWRQRASVPPAPGGTR